MRIIYSENICNLWAVRDRYLSVASDIYPLQRVFEHYKHH